MIGKSLLLSSIENEQISEIITLVRNPTNIAHPKVTEIVHDDFYNLSDYRELLTRLDAAFYCLGISAAGLSEKQYKEITYDLTISIARELQNLNPGITICYISGAGTDSSEKGKTMWARIKGRTENALISMHGNNAYMFRPGYIQPMKGVKSKTWWYNALYLVFAPLYPVFKLFLGKYVLTSVELSKAMLVTAKTGYRQRILEISDIKSQAQKQ